MSAIGGIGAGIPPLGGIIQTGVERTPNTPRPGGMDLGSVFESALAEARTTEKSSVEQAEKFALGDPSVGIHEVMIAAEEANLNLRFSTTLKNKAIEAYRELMATQV